MLLVTTLALALSAASPTADLIREMHPRTTSVAAARIARSIDAAAARYGVEPEVLAAIVHVETRFSGGLVQCGYATWRRGGVRHSRWTCDYGIAQVNQWWVGHWDLDAERLKSDDRYNLMVAARILRLLKRQFGGEATWWGRYHSSTPALRAAYEAQVLPLLKLVEPVEPQVEYQQVLGYQEAL